LNRREDFSRSNEWAAKNPRATFKAPITVEDVLNSRMIAYPFRLLQCCLRMAHRITKVIVKTEKFASKLVYVARRMIAKRRAKKLKYNVKYCTIIAKLVGYRIREKQALLNMEWVRRRES